MGTARAAVSQPLARAVGIVALAAPALHSVTDVMEWRAGGFGTLQLSLNLLAFLPMPALLPALFALQRPRPPSYGLAGAVLYGAAFVYFSFTTLFALYHHIADYQVLWTRLGATYTFFGALMVVGGLLFAVSSLKSRWFPAAAVWLFLAGLTLNLVVALLPLPDLLQTIGSGVRNLGLMTMGAYILSAPTAAKPARLQ